MSRQSPKKTRRKTETTPPPVIRPFRTVQQTEQHLGMAWSVCRQKKRQEWKTLVDALQIFEYGAAYTPVGLNLFELRRAADRISTSMAEDWEYV